MCVQVAAGGFISSVLGGKFLSYSFCVCDSEDVIFLASGMVVFYPFPLFLLSAL